MMGLPADRTKLACYAASGALAGLAGVILAAQFGAGQPIEGVGWELFAIAAVVVYHLDPGWLPGGFLGVDVFFVVSGFLITTLLVREAEQARAEAALGDAFDPRAFHAQVLGDGSLPLDVLEAKIDRWIAAKKAS